MTALPDVESLAQDPLCVAAGEPAGPRLFSASLTDKTMPDADKIVGLATMKTGMAAGNESGGRKWQPPRWL